MFLINLWLAKKVSSMNVPRLSVVSSHHDNNTIIKVSHRVVCNFQFVKIKINIFISIRDAKIYLDQYLDLCDSGNPV